MRSGPFDRFQEICRNFKQPYANWWTPSRVLPGSQRTRNLAMVPSQLPDCRQYVRQQIPSPATTAGLRLDQSPLSDQTSARAFEGADLLASPLPSKSASIFRAREAGTRAFNMRFSRPGTILERFLSRPLRPSDTHCSTLIGFIGMVFGSRPNFSSTAVFVNPAASTVT